MILPARSHPDVCIYGVAARDKTRAQAYAEQYDIPRTYASYRELIEDPCIDVVYIALPNSHHYEWAHDALHAGKHLLLEKPSTSNSAEAQALLSRPSSHTPLSPVILEAFHYRFHPAWQKFLSIVHDPQLGASVAKVECNSYLWRGAFPQDDIRFSLALSGGCVMDFATYCLSCVRDVTRDPSPVVESVKFRTQDTAQGGSDQIDEAVWIQLRSASGTEVSIEADMAKKGDLPFLPATWCQNWPSFGWPKCVVKLSEMPVDGQQDGAQISETHCIQRTVTLWNLVFLHLWHTIEVSDQHVIRKESQVIRTWEVKKTIKAYEPPGESKSRNPGCELWSTYRYQYETPEANVFSIR